jgi:hypothetical protein
MIKLSQVVQSHLNDLSVEMMGTADPTRIQFLKALLFKNRELDMMVSDDYIAYVWHCVSKGYMNMDSYTEYAKYCKNHPEFAERYQVHKL